MGTYIIKSGDTLSAIARKHNTTVNALMSINKNISNANVIRVGQVINLPTPALSAPEKDYAALGLKVEKCVRAIEALPEFKELENLL